MHLAILSIIRNEARRWLPSVLRTWEQIADTIIVLDDNSDDDTPQLLKASPKVDYRRRGVLTPMWGDEAPVRQALWDLFINSGADWGLWLDADMLPASNPRSLFVDEVAAVAFPLYDLWSIKPYLYRHDGYWKAHTNPRIWAVQRPRDGFEAKWNDRGIHCGHLPLNLSLPRVIIAPPEYSLLHLAYSDAAERAAKYAAYMSRSFQLNRTEYEHAASIIDRSVECNLLPFPVEYDIAKV